MLRAGGALTARPHAALLRVTVTELVFSDGALCTQTRVFTACLLWGVHPTVCTFDALVLKNADSFGLVEGESVRMSN